MRWREDTRAIDHVYVTDNMRVADCMPPRPCARIPSIARFWSFEQPIK